MASVNDVIADAALLASVGDQYNPLDSASVQTALRAFNRMLDSWSAEFTPLFNIVDGFTGAPTPGFVLTTGQSLYTLGVANLLGVMPTGISDIFLRDGNNVDYYITPIQADEYSRLIYKIAPGRPDRCYINFNQSTVELIFYPTPAYNDQCHILYQQPLMTTSNLSTVLVFPRGYEEAFTYNLALRICDYFGAQAPPAIVQRAAWLKDTVSAANENTYLLQNPMPTQKRRFFNILTGGTV